MTTDKKQAKPEEIAKGCGILIVLAFIVGIFMFICGDDEQPAEKKEAFTAWAAYYHSQEAVKERLKSPGTAEFPYMDVDNPEGVVSINDTTFFVQSYVDSQNGFGALIRSNYSCTVIYTRSTDMVLVKDLQLTER